jgi:hypothetical protein
MGMKPITFACTKDARSPRGFRTRMIDEERRDRIERQKGDEEQDQCDEK